MTTTADKQVLSGSTDGLQIEITDTATPGQEIHISSTVSGALDEVWLFVDNDNSAATVLTIEWGGATDITNTMKFSIDGDQELKLLIPGLLVTNAKEVRAFAASANRIKISGFINRLA